MRVDLDTIEVAFAKIVARMREAGADAVDLSDDFYWFIPREERYNPHAAPRNMTMGQLTDDWNEVRKIANGDAPPIAYSLCWLAAILTAAGERSLT